MLFRVLGEDTQRDTSAGGSVSRHNRRGSAQLREEEYRRPVPWWYHQSIAVGIGVPNGTLVHHPITIVVQSVAIFRCTGEYRIVRVIAIPVQEEVPAVERRPVQRHRHCPSHRHRHP